MTKPLAIISVICVFVLAAVFAERIVSSQSQQVADGLAYLKSTQNADGSWGGTATSLNGGVPTTATALQALRAVEGSTSANQTNAIQFLSSQTVDVNPFVAARVNALAGTSASIAADRDVLFASQNEDGGWATASDFQSDALDTSMALLALHSAGVNDSSIAQRGLIYLLRMQNADGGWALTKGEDSQVFYTAYGLLALDAYRSQFDAGVSRSRAVSFLRSIQNANGGYGNPAGNPTSTAFETALALLAIFDSGQQLTPAETNAINYLNTTQKPNGSWVDDAYSTALAIRALAFPKDSDGDGMPDDCENANGLNPNDPADALQDKDNDGLTNLQECRTRCTNANNPDTDGDGVGDGEENSNGSNPCDPTSHNHAPVISSQAPTTASQQQLYSYQVQATDADNDSLTYALLRSPTGMTISNSGLIQWTPAADQFGAFTVIIKVSDGRGASAIQQYKLTVLTQGVDLTIAAVNLNNVITDPQTLVVSGAATVNLQNKGGSLFAGVFNVLLFEDRNGNGTYQAGTDGALGSEMFTGSIDSNATAPLDVRVSGVVQFRDNLVYAFVDSLNQVPELDENNNYGHSGVTSKYQPPVGDYLPKVKWQYDDATSGAEGLGSTPIVAPLIDTNGDGLINERDVPAVIFVPKSALSDRPTALRGDTGAVIFKGTNSGARILDTFFSTPAVGDIDGDGKPEILVNAIYFENPSRVYCFNNDGTLKWSSAPITGAVESSLVIADMDGDGKPEIVGQAFCLNFDGTLRWNRSNQQPTYRGGFYHNAAAIPADLDLDGKQEVILGPKVLDKDGQILWSWSSAGVPGNYTVTGKLDRGATNIVIQSDSILSDSYIAIANLDDDQYPEIIAVTDDNASGGAGPFQSAWIFEHDGRIKAGPIHLFQGISNQLAFRLGPPTVADFDGDGQPEIAIPVLRRPVGTPSPSNHRQHLLNVYKFSNNTLELQWQKDFIAGGGDDAPPPVTAFDFDGDGAQEPVYLDSQRLYILNGATGATRFEMGVERTNEQADQRYPVIADVDNDGVAEIVVPTLLAYRANAPARKGVLALGDTRGNWRSARRVWNEWVYRITNVNENGLIPQTAKPSWQGPNSFRAQSAADGVDRFAAPDLSVSKVTINSQNCPASAGITARIGNGGSLHAGAGLAINFYLGDPSAGGILIGTKKTSKLLMPGEFEDVTLLWNAPVAGRIFVTVNDPLASSLVGSSNLSQLPNSWVQSSGFEGGGSTVNYNVGAIFGVDGKTNTFWSDQGTLSTGPSFYEVRFPFPVNASSVTIQNTGSSTTGFLAGTLSFSNGFTQPVTLNANGEGTVAFSEQQNVTWIRLTASSTKANGASLSEFLVAGSYAEPQFRLREGTGRSGNNKASSPSNLSPCDSSGNQPPVITSAPPIIATAGVAYAYQVTATDPNNDALSYSLTNGPSGMTMNASGMIVWTPADAQAGDQNVAVQVSDGRGGTAQQQFTIRVVLGAGNHAPRITSIPPATVQYGRQYVYDAMATDPDNDSVLYSMVNAPAGSAMDQLTGRLTWTPISSQTGIQFFTVQADDGRGGKSPQSFTVVVQAAPAPTPTPDKDHDGYDETEDCDDLDASVNPGQVEIPGNGKDDDCNAETPDSLPPNAITCSIVTDKRSYSSHSLTNLVSRIQNQAATLTANGLDVQVTIRSSSNQTIFTGALPATAIAPHGLFKGTTSFETGTYPPGNYNATLNVRYSSQSVCTAQASFTIVSRPTTTGLSGSITVTPNILERPASATFTYLVMNVGNLALTPVEVKVLLVNAATEALVQTFDQQTSLNQSPPFSNSMSFSSSAVPAGDYLVILQSQSGGVTQTLSSAPLRVNSSTMHLNPAGYTVTEGCSTAKITVTRTGDAASEASVDYATSNGTALHRTDYSIASGTLRFGVGETSKSFNVLVNEDGYAEGNESLTIRLSNATDGAGIGLDGSTTLTITDNDGQPSTTNPIDEAGLFVCQHYHDFLSREADPDGSAYWTSQITQCGSDPICIRNKRNDVSNAFFYEREFQESGSYVYRMYRAAFGNNQPFPNPDPDPLHPGEEKKVPLYSVFVRDRARVQGGSQLPQLQLALANVFVQRAEFLAKYPATLDGSSFIDALLAAMKNDIGVDLTSQEPALMSLYDSGGRGAVLYRLCDDSPQTNPVANRAFIDAEYNRAFVFTQYAGYLRRDADMGGFLFWLGQVNRAPIRDGAKQHAMVCSFITSAEYQNRFSSIVTHTNAECPP